MKTIIAVDIYYTSGKSLLVCFPLVLGHHCLNVQQGDCIAYLPDITLEFEEKDPTEKAGLWLNDIGPNDSHDEYCIVAERILTVWQDGQPIRLIRTSVEYFEEGAKNRAILDEGVEPSLENAWQIVKHLEQQFKTRIFYDPGTDSSETVPEWFKPIIDCHASTNPIYDAAKNLRK